MSFTGGCQCGAVRFEARRLGRSSICHCRMCQKATGGFFGPYVDVHDFAWTKGAPKYGSRLSLPNWCRGVTSSGWSSEPMVTAMRGFSMLR